MLRKRTDLAVEAKEIWQETAEDTTKLEGVEADEFTEEGYYVEIVKILNDKGEKALNKPIGTYITISLENLLRKNEGAFENGLRVLSRHLKL